nr:orf100EGC134 [uncultured bacterium]
MDMGTRQLLNRWQSLRTETGLSRAATLARGLWFVGLALFFLVVFGLYYGLPPVALAIVSAAMGWVIAERNALKSRIAQWPTVSSYIDWERVSSGLDGNQ